ncbi:hypothetical protein ACFQZI_04920 [Mucilaginibacter lutimaris]|uniref:Uncharacterized protein n=1 Tax=Mucilaginibacter lutimaris TaxID=931629 RepID=A0ABW2ZDC4_9SPHI
MKKWYALVMLLFPLCMSVNDNCKDYDFNYFKLSVPANWEYKKGNGIDAFTGTVTGAKILLKFNFSEQGFSPNLNISDDENEHDYLIKTEKQGNFIRKLVISKKASQGMTGIYIYQVHRSIEDFRSFSMVGFNLSETQQSVAIKVFKTIKLK